MNQQRTLHLPISWPYFRNALVAVGCTTRRRRLTAKLTLPTSNSASPDCLAAFFACKLYIQTRSLLSLTRKSANLFSACWISRSACARLRRHSASSTVSGRHAPGGRKTYHIMSQIFNVSSVQLTGWPPGHSFVWTSLPDCVFTRVCE